MPFDRNLSPEGSLARPVSSLPRHTRPGFHAGGGGGSFASAPWAQGALEPKSHARTKACPSPILDRYKIIFAAAADVVKGTETDRLREGCEDHLRKKPAPGDAGQALALR